MAQPSPFLGEPSSGKKKIICHRCLEPVPAHLSRCPRCRVHLHAFRRLGLFFGVVGLVAVLFVIGLMLKMARVWEIENAPAPTQKEQPTKPAGPPPLNS